MKLIKVISLLLALSLLPLALAACAEKSSPKPMSKTYYEYFDTVSTVSSYLQDSEEEFEANAMAVEELLKKYHRLCDIYYEYSGVNNIRTVNRNAGKSPVKVDTELIEFLLYAKEICKKTEGESNIMMGSLLTLWHEFREDAEDGQSSVTPPAESELRAAAEHISLDALVIDTEASTVFITDPDARIDVGAIAKGYATEKAAELLISRKVSSYVLNIGGNLRIVGEKPNGDGWVTGITNPDKNADGYALKLYLKDTSCVTSGNYERYVTVGDKRYHHIIDKDTLYPAEYFASVSVITKDSAIADSLSTALFCMPYEEGLALAKSFGDVEVIWIYKNGETVTTDGIKKLIYS